MIIVMQKNACNEEINAVIEYIRSYGLTEHVSYGSERTIIGAVGDERIFDPQQIQQLSGVETAVRVLHDWRIISRETQPDNRVITVRQLAFGHGQQRKIVPFSPTINYDTIDAIFVDPFFIPQSPYTQQVTKYEQQILSLQEVLTTVHAQKKPVLVRIRDVRQLDPVLKAEADIIYLGGELMANRTLQNEIGNLNVPLVLCKDKHHQVNDWLVAAEHIALKGNHHIMLGEAGTLALDHNTPYRLDVEGIAQAKKLTNLPIIANVLNLTNQYMTNKILSALAQSAGADAVIQYHEM